MHKFKIKMDKTYKRKLCTSLLSLEFWMEVQPGIKKVYSYIDNVEPVYRIEIEKDKLEFFLMDFEKWVTRNMSRIPVYEVFSFEAETDCEGELLEFTTRRKKRHK